MANMLCSECKLFVPKEGYSWGVCKGAPEIAERLLNFVSTQVPQGQVRKNTIADDCLSFTKDI